MNIKKRKKVIYQLKLLSHLMLMDENMDNQMMYISIIKSIQHEIRR